MIHALIEVDLFLKEKLKGKRLFAHGMGQNST